MDQAQLRQFTQRIRELRTSPPTFAKALRKESDEEEEDAKPAKQKKATKSAASVAGEYI